MSRVSGLINILGSLESDKLAVHKNRCIAIRNRNANCLRCAESCTSNVFSYVAGELRIDVDRCIGCGTCATACPTCAIEIKKPSDAELAAAVKRSLIATTGRPIFACEVAVNSVLVGTGQERGQALHDVRHDSCETYHDAHYTHKTYDACKNELGRVLDAEKVCVVPCLGRIDESLLVSLAAYKASAAHLVCGGCKSCEHAPGGEMVEGVLASAHSLLMAFDGDIPMMLTTDMPEEAFASNGKLYSASDGAVSNSGSAVSNSGSASEGLSRRDFFKSLGQKSGNLVAVAANEVLKDATEQDTLPKYEKVNKDGTLSQHIPSRRTLVYNYLAHIGNPVLESVSSRIIGLVSIDTQKCNSCQMCAVFCPTGALKKCGKAKGAGAGGKAEGAGTRVSDAASSVADACAVAAASNSVASSEPGKPAEAFGILHRPSLCVQCELCQSICPQNAIKVSCEVPVMQFIGKQATRFEMNEPEWIPNKPDSMYNKFHGLLGKDLEMCMF